MRNKDWQMLEDFVVQKLKEIDHSAHTTKASGGSTIKGDISNNINLHIECKQRNIKSVYNQDWYEKCQTEVPLHSDKIAIIITENKDKERMVHLSFEDFWEIYKNNLQYKENLENKIERFDRE